jgi:hypothetical protein
MPNAHLIGIIQPRREEKKKKKTEEDGRANPKGVFSVIKGNQARGVNLELLLIIMRYPSG